MQQPDPPTEEVISDPLDQLDDEDEDDWETDPSNQKGKEQAST